MEQGKATAAISSGRQSTTDKEHDRGVVVIDAAVRRVVESTGESLNEHVVRHTVETAHMDLADRRLYAVDDDVWSALQESRDRPAMRKPDLVRLLVDPSVLEAGRS